MPLPPEYRSLLDERIHAIKAPVDPGVRIYPGASLVDIAGSPRRLPGADLSLSPASPDGGPRTATLSTGAILVAYDPQPAPLGERWYDRSRVKTQSEFQAELARSSI